MAEESLITDEMRKRVGQDFIKPIVFDVEKGAILKFAQAMEDSNPLWQDEEYAKKAGYKTIMAPPIFLYSVGLPEVQKAGFSLPVPLKRVMAEGLDCEYLKPVYAGDTVTITTKLAQLSEKETRLGKMLYLLIERTVTDQKGEIVAKQSMGVSRY